MSTLVSVVLTNAVCAALLSVAVLLVGRVCRRPALLHGLWLLVLLKLVTPPLWPVTVVELPEEPAVTNEAPAAPLAMPQEMVQPSTPAEIVSGLDGVEKPRLTARSGGRVEPAPDNGPADSAAETKAVGVAGVGDDFVSVAETIPPTPVAAPQPHGLRSWVPLVVLSWLTGVIVWLAWAGVYAYRFQRLLRYGRPAGAVVQEQARDLARRMGLRHCPEVWLLPGPLPPLVWGVFGRVRVFFPAKLLDRLDETERASLLAHELAHVRRRDHWVRWVELIAAALYWWYPLVWLARRRLHVHEEECCDAWVVGEVPARSYAAAILSTLDFLAEERPSLPAMASGLTGVEQLKRRLTFIMGNDTPKRLSGMGRLVLLCAGLLLLSVGPNLAQSAKKAEAPGAKVEPTKAESAPAELAEDPTAFETQPRNLIGGNNDFWSVAVSQDGKRLAASGGWYDRPGDVRVWDLTTRKQLFLFREPLGAPSVAISPDGRLLAWASWTCKGHIRELATGREVARLELDAVAQVAFSPDSKLLATASQGNTVALWDATTGRKLATLEGDVFRFHCVAFSPDGKLLAAGGGNWEANGVNQVNIYDVATRKQVKKLQGHTGAVLAVAFSPDGRTIGTGGVDYTVRLWEAATGKLKFTMPAGTHWVEGVAFSPDGKTVVADTAGNVATVWDAARGRELGRFQGHSGKVKSLAFSPDGKHLASASSDRTVKWWDVVTRTELATFRRVEDQALEGQPLAIAASPDGRTLAVALDDQTVQLRDSQSGDLHGVLKGHEDAVTCLAYSPDGKLLATASPDQKIKLWDPATGKEVRTLTGHTNWIYAVAFAPDGKTLASGGYDRTIRLWDPATGEVRRIIKGHKASIRALAFSPDGKTFASGSSDRTIKHWPRTGEGEPVTFKGHEGAVHVLVFSPDGKTLASGGDDQTIKLWDVAGKSERAALKGHSSEVMSLVFSPRGKTLVSGAADSSLILWDPTTGKQLGQLRGHSDAVTGVVIAPDGRRLLSTGVDRTVKVWTAQSLVARLRGHTGPVVSLALSRDGRRLLSGSGWPEGDKAARLWDLKTGKKIRTFQVQKSPAGVGSGEDASQIEAVALSPDGKQAALASSGGVVSLRDVEKGVELRRFHGHTGIVSALDFTPDGQRLLSGGQDKTIRLWEVRSGREIRKFEGHTEWIRSVRLARDGKRFLSGGRDGTMRLWDAEGGKQLRKFPAAPKGAVETVTWMPDNRKALCAGGESDVQLWDVETGELVRTFRGHAYGVTGLDVSSDGSRALSCGYDGAVRYWNVATGQQLRIFREIGFARAVKFSPDDRRAFSAGGGRSEGDGKYVPGGDDFPIHVWLLDDEQRARPMPKAVPASPASR